MRRLLLAVLCYNLLLFSCIPAVAAEVEEPAETAEYEGYIVKLTNRSKAKLFSGNTSDLGAVERICNDLLWVEEEETAEKLQNNGMAQYVEPNYKAELFEDEETEEIKDGWAYQKIETDYARDLDLDGSGITIGIIDSGIDLNNADLQEADIATGYDYVNETTEMDDSDYHGTKVAQIISGDRNAIGGTGVSPESVVVPLRCFDGTNGGTIKLLVKAITDAVDVYGCDVINMSWGIGTDSQTLHDAMIYAYEKGVILVAAGGNVSSAYPQRTVMYPSAYDEVIGVASVNSTLKVASDSQQYDGVFVCAPGVKVPTVLKTGIGSTCSGTSFAAPYITGELALIKQLAPFADPSEIMELLQERAVDLGDEGYDTSYGYGLARLDSVIDTHWGAFKSDIENDSDVMAQFWLTEKDGGSVVIASTEDSGKSAEISITSITGLPRSNQRDISTDGKEIRMIFLDSGYCPVSSRMMYSEASN